MSSFLPIKVAEILHVLNMGEYHSEISFLHENIAKKVTLPNFHVIYVFWKWFKNSILRPLATPSYSYYCAFF